jgi:lysine 2,3-aminomutase
MPNLSIDIPGGGGKVGVVPEFQTSSSAAKREYRGWDGMEGVYSAPAAGQHLEPCDAQEYLSEWEEIKNQPYGSVSF